MARVGAIAVFVALMAVAPAVASPIITISGVVVGAEPTTKSLFVADSQGRVFLVLAPRVAPVGAVVRVRGERSNPSWTIVASGRDARLTRTGRVARAVVKGELGFVDVAERRFQLAAHGQIVGEVSFAARFAPALRRLSSGPSHPLLFHLSIRAGRLSLAAVPR